MPITFPWGSEILRSVFRGVSNADEPKKGRSCQRVFTPWRLTWYPRAYLFAIVVSFLIVLFTGNGASTLSGRLGGDYPAFYAAGRMIARGDGNHLYDINKQAAMQKDLFPGEGSVFMPFPYPPFAAAACYPLSLLNFRLSYAVYTALMMAAVLASIWLLRPVHDLIGRHFLLFVCVAMSFYPMLRAVTGGQNTAIALLLIVASWRAVLVKRDMLAGVMIGLLLFKPQFALPLIGLYVVSGRWRVGVGAVLTTVLLYGVAAMTSGPDWPAQWYQFLLWLSPADAAINHDKAVSWIGFLQAVLGWGNHLALTLGLGFSLLTAIFLLFIWGRAGRQGDVTALLAITLAALVLMPPHVNYYDLGLVFFTCLAFARVRNDNPWMPLVVIWLLCFAQPLSGCLGVSLLFPVALLALLWSIRSLGRFAIQPNQWGQKNGFCCNPDVQ